MGIKIEGFGPDERTKRDMEKVFFVEYNQFSRKYEGIKGEKREKISIWRRIKWFLSR
tara:strand:+ start:530 stop:700 length:171 start_codon:yes stop_codon:yes gene_type:complete